MIGYGCAEDSKLQPLLRINLSAPAYNLRITPNEGCIVLMVVQIT
jgi:hypothetical protein